VPPLPAAAAEAAGLVTSGAMLASYLGVG